MKIKLIAILALLNIATITQAGWTDWSVTPYAALRSDNITDGNTGGAGIDIGYNVNNTVSIHSLLTSWSDDDWGGRLIDEASLLVRADLIRSGKERFVTYAIGGVDRDLNGDHWGFGVGGGFELRLWKNFSLGGDTRIQALIEDDERLMTRGFARVRW